MQKKVMITIETYLKKTPYPYNPLVLIAERRVEGVLANCKYKIFL